MVGIVETKEVLVAANKIGVLICKLAKDGFQFSDVEAIVGAIVNDEEFRKCLTKAVENVVNVPSELSELDLMEMFSLAQTQIAFVPEYIDALKK